MTRDPPPAANDPLPLMATVECRYFSLMISGVRDYLMLVRIGWRELERDKSGRWEFHPTGERRVLVGEVNRDSLPALWRDKHSSVLMQTDPTMRYALQRVYENGEQFFGCYRLREKARTGPYICKFDLNADDDRKLYDLAQLYALNKD